MRDTKACYPDWAAVYADNAIWVYRMIFNRVGNQPDAEDLTTEVFLAALRPLRLSATVAEVRGYLRATTRSVLSSYWRAARERENHIDRRCRGPAAQRRADHRQRPSTTLDRVLAALPDNTDAFWNSAFARLFGQSRPATWCQRANAKVLQHRALRLAAELSE